MDRRDVLAIPAVVLAATIVTLMSKRWGWSEDEFLLAGTLAIIVTGTLIWHVDWSRFSRRGSERAKHL